jgi:hypothetical protein
MQYLDINRWMVGDILLKADRMSMAHSLELRVPFLDRDVFAVARRIPVKHRIGGGTTKYAMRLAAKRHIPAAAAEKPKLGFPVPIRVWLRQQKYYDIVKTAFLSPVKFPCRIHQLRVIISCVFNSFIVCFIYHDDSPFIYKEEYYDYRKKERIRESVDSQILFEIVI